jgi:hypothetical protein
MLWHSQTHSTCATHSAVLLLLLAINGIQQSTHSLI